MSILQALRPFLRGASHVNFTVSEEAGSLVILSTSKLKKVDEDTSDPELAAIQSALAMPRRIVVPNGIDPDVEVLKALTAMAAPYTGVAQQLDDYASRMTELSNQAKAAQQTKAEKGTAKATKAAPAKSASKSKTTPAAVSEVSDADAEDSDESEQSDTDSSTSTTITASAPAPEPTVGTTADVFKDF